MFPDRFQRLSYPTFDPERPKSCGRATKRTRFTPPLKGVGSLAALTVGAEPVGSDTKRSFAAGVGRADDAAGWPRLQNTYNRTDTILYNG